MVGARPVTSPEAPRTPAPLRSASAPADGNSVGPPGKEPPGARALFFGGGEGARGARDTTGCSGGDETPTKEKKRKRRRQADVSRPRETRPLVKEEDPYQGGRETLSVRRQTEKNLRPRLGGEPQAFRQTVMILPQVHLRKPCYDFYFL